MPSMLQSALLPAVAGHGSGHRHCSVSQERFVKTTFRRIEHVALLQLSAPMTAGAHGAIGSVSNSAPPFRRFVAQRRHSALRVSAGLLARRSVLVARRLYMFLTGVVFLPPPLGTRTPVRFLLPLIGDVDLWLVRNISLFFLPDAACGRNHFGSVEVYAAAL